MKCYHSESLQSSRATAVQDRRGRGPRTSALPAVRGCLRCPRSAVSQSRPEVSLKSDLSWPKVGPQSAKSLPGVGHKSNKSRAAAVQKSPTRRQLLQSPFLWKSRTIFDANAYWKSLFKSRVSPDAWSEAEKRYIDKKKKNQ